MTFPLDPNAAENASPRIDPGAPVPGPEIVPPFEEGDRVRTVLGDPYFATVLATERVAHGWDVLVLPERADLRPGRRTIGANLLVRARRAGDSA